jgi:hypothetical protein
MFENFTTLLATASNFVLCAVANSCMYKAAYGAAVYAVGNWDPSCQQLFEVVLNF